MSKDEVVEEQDQAQEPQDLLLDNAGDPEHEIARVPPEEANEIDIERPDIQHPQSKEQQMVETTDEEVEEAKEGKAVPSNDEQEKIDHGDNRNEHLTSSRGRRICPVERTATDSDPACKNRRHAKTNANWSGHCDG